MKKQRVQVDHIFISDDRARLTIDEETVTGLAASISKIGLQNPISIQYTDHVVDGEEMSDVPVLVSGAHRLTALKRLGIAVTECIVFTDKHKARQWEISENLHRSELTALEHDEHVAEWIALENPDNKSDDVISFQSETKLKTGSNPKGAGRKESGVSAAARELKIGEVAAWRAAKVASLPEEAKDSARKLGLDDNRTALLAAEKAKRDAEKNDMDGTAAAVKTLKDIAKQKETAAKAKATQRENPKPIEKPSEVTDLLDAMRQDQIDAKWLFKTLGKRNMVRMIGILRERPKQVAALIEQM